MRTIRNMYMVAMAACACLWLKDFFLPHGPAVPLESRLQYANVDPSNDLLRLHHGRVQKIYERVEDGREGEEPLLHGPETVVLDDKGNIFVMTDRARLLMLTDLQPQKDSANTLTAQVTVVRNDLGRGRPLGGAFTRNGKYLYLADAHFGLIRIRDPKNDLHSKVEIVASKVTLPSGEVSPILYANDVAVGPKSGKVYFTDSTTIAPDLIDQKWDTLHAAKMDLMRGSGTGRLMVYDPETDQTTVLVTGLRFANGVSVDADETFVFVAETYGIKLHAYHLHGGAKQGTLEVVMESKDMTGYVDGVDCTKDGDTVKCYAAVVCAMIPLHKLLLRLPDPFDRWLRTLILTVPRKWAPKTTHYGGVIEIVDPLSSTSKEIRYFQDPTGEDVSVVSGVTCQGNKLYLGTLTNDYIAVYNL